MGCGGSKVADAVESSGSSSPSGGGHAEDDIETVQGSDKVRTFRERRLSMSQQQDTNARPRRLSIYGNHGDTDMQPLEVQSPCPTCGCRTMGGLEPAPGGLVAKINQDRGLAIYPWDNDLTAGLFGVYDGHGRIGQEVSEFVIQNLPAALREQLLSAAHLSAQREAVTAEVREMTYIP